MSDEHEPSWDDYPSPEEPYVDAVSGPGGIPWLVVGGLGGAALGIAMRSCMVDPVANDGTFSLLLLGGLATLVLVGLGCLLEFVHGTSRLWLCGGSALAWWIGFNAFAMSIEACGFE